MAENGPTVGDYIDEFHREAAKLANVVDEVAEHHNNGDHKSAASVAALSHYNIGHLTAARQSGWTRTRSRELKWRLRVAG